MLGIHSQITFFVGKKYVTNINYAKSIFNIITVKHPLKFKSITYDFRRDFTHFNKFDISLLIANASV